MDGLINRQATAAPMKQVSLHHELCYAFFSCSQAISFYPVIYRCRYKLGWLQPDQGEINLQSLSPRICPGFLGAVLPSMRMSAASLCFQLCSRLTILSYPRRKMHSQTFVRQLLRLPKSSSKLAHFFPPCVSLTARKVVLTVIGWRSHQHMTCPAFGLVSRAIRVQVANLKDLSI